MPSYPYFP
jgi:hypothetical protein